MRTRARHVITRSVRSRQRGAACPRRHRRRMAGSGAGGENLAAGTWQRPEALRGPRPPQRRICPRSGFWKPGPEYGRFAHATSAPAPIRVTSPDPVAPPAATRRAGTSRGSQIPGTRPAAPGAPGPDPGHPRHQNHRSSGRAPEAAPASRVLTVPRGHATPSGLSAPAPARKTPRPKSYDARPPDGSHPAPEKFRRYSAQSKVNQAVAAHRISHTRPEAAGKQSRRSENCRPMPWGARGRGRAATAAGAPWH